MPDTPKSYKLPKEMFQTDQEPWDWGRWFGGRISGRRIMKSAGILLDQLVVLAVIGAFVLAAVWIHGRTRPAPPTPDIVTAETANIDKSQQTVTINEFPFSRLFDAGSKGKKIEKK